MRKTLPDLLWDTQCSFPDNPALSFFGRTMNYRELHRQAEKFAAFLRLQGLRPGDRVLLLLPNCPQMDIACWGIWKAGCVMAALNPLLKSDELLKMAQLVRPKLLVTVQDFDAHNRVLAAVLCPQTAIMMVSLADYLPPVLAAGYRAKNFWKRSNPPHHYTWQSTQLTRREVAKAYKMFGEVPGPDDLAVLQFTGGTTGSVKAAMLTHANLVANTSQAMDLVGRVVTENSVVCTIIPCFHVYGLSVGVVLAASRGAKVVMVPKFMDVRMVYKDGKKVAQKFISKEVLRVFRDERITLFPGIPDLFAAMVEDERFQDMEMNSLRLCVSGSGALEPSVKRRFQSWAGCEIIEGYGLSEASPIVAINPPGGALPGSLGIPVRDTEIKIIPEPDAKPEEGGELWVKGPQVMIGYWDNPYETNMVLTHDGWLQTGDMVVRQGEHLVMTCRKKDMIKVSGENVYPGEIEKILLERLDISEAYVVGVPDEKTGERVVACVVPKPDATPCDLAAIREACNGLSRIKVPKEVANFSREQIPRTYLGKVQKKELRKMLTKAPA